MYESLPSKSPAESSVDWRNRLKEFAAERHEQWLERLNSGDEKTIGEFLHVLAVVERTHLISEDLAGETIERNYVSSESNPLVAELMESLFNQNGALDRGDPEAAAEAVRMHELTMRMDSIASIDLN